MTPYALGIVLHYYARADEHSDAMRNPNSWQDNVDRLVDMGLIRPRRDTTNYSGTYETTERGEVYVKAVLALPLPVQAWVMPNAAATGERG